MAFLFFVSPCCDKSDDFSCVKFESRRFVGGTVRSPSGTNYILEIEANKNIPQIEFEAVWVGNRKFIQLEVLSDSRPWAEKKIKKGDVLTILFKQLILHSEPNEEANPEVDLDGEISDPPIQYSGNALVQYSVKGKKKFLEVENMTQVKPLLYP